MKVKDGQSIIDIAIQELGSAEGAYDIAVLNDISITDTLNVGTELTMPDVVNKSIAAYYKYKRINPATSLCESDTVLLPGGIGYWCVGVDFIVHSDSGIGYLCVGIDFTVN
ncbi:MAG: hypothetical protein PHH37_08280 [Paludibacter sp.]|nr:hypothetical protein [Paludibacter sp.]